MSLKVGAIGSVPEMTVRVARAAFPKDNVYMKMRDELGSIYTDEQFVNLFPRRGQPSEAPWRLALVTVMQLTGPSLGVDQTIAACNSSFDLTSLYSTTGLTATWYPLFCLE